MLNELILSTDWAIVLVSVGLGLQLVILWAVLRTGRTRESTTTDLPETENQPRKQKQETIPVTSSMDKKPQAELTVEQEETLRHRVEVGGGFLVEDAAVLLSTTPKDIVNRARTGELSGYQDQTRRLWIKATSIADVLSSQTRDNALAESAPSSSDFVPISSPARVSPLARVSRKSTGKSVKPARATQKPKLFGQIYWYYADGQNTRYSSLPAVLESIGYTKKVREWAKIPSDIRDRIRREKI